MKKSIWILSLVIMSIITFSISDVWASETTNNYKSFFKKFMNDESYQATHIIFPYKYYYDGPEGKVSKNVQKSKYKYFNCFKGEESSYKYKIMSRNQFKVERRGVESGIYVDYFFKKSGSDFYLVKIFDRST